MGKKTQSQEIEKTSHRLGDNPANDTSDKGFFSRIHKELVKLNNKKLLLKVKIKNFMLYVFATIIFFTYPAFFPSHYIPKK